MNDRIRELIKISGLDYDELWTKDQLAVDKFAELIVEECADICMEMAAKCSGLPGEGALAKDCADWIKKDFGVKE